MKYLVLTALAAVISFSTVLADPLWEFSRPVCGDTYHRDSYGRGLEAGFKVLDLRPRLLLDEGCYRLGFDAGTALRDEKQPDCDRLFHQGYLQGLQGKFEVRDSAGNCHNAGYEAGGAALDVWAREGEVARVGERCVHEHARGYQDASKQLAATGAFEQPAWTCYMVGYMDYFATH